MSRRPLGVLKRAKLCPLKNPGGRDTAIVFVCGEGEAGERGAPAGDLYVQVRVKQHPGFRWRRQSFIAKCRSILLRWRWQLGGEIEVLTLDGRVMLKVPSETQTGKLPLHARQRREVRTR
ncbi:hypothetical protein KCP71_01820 [Salmonella enterica subsp. enterica]|nr:hypothetical protein KCP71_01820 [Salmonella enterica subsp. enterica]